MWLQFFFFFFIQGRFSTLIVPAPILRPLNLNFPKCVGALHDFVLNMNSENKRKKPPVSLELTGKTQIRHPINTSFLFNQVVYLSPYENLISSNSILISKYQWV